MKSSKINSMILLMMALLFACETNTEDTNYLRNGDTDILFGIPDFTVSGLVLDSTVNGKIYFRYAVINNGENALMYNDTIAGGERAVLQKYRSVSDTLELNMKAAGGFVNSDFRFAEHAILMAGDSAWVSENYTINSIDSTYPYLIINFISPSRLNEIKLQDNFAWLKLF